MRLHIHRWSSWSELRNVSLLSGGFVRRQDRTCKRCNFVEERSV